MANVDTDKRKQSDTVYNSVADLLHCVYDKCKEESINGLQIPLELYEERVLNYTNTPRHFFNEVLERKTALPGFDLYERIIISDSLLEYYEKKEAFSFKDVYETIRKKNKLSGLFSLSQFCHDMSSLGFEHVNTFNCGQIVLENPKMAHERWLYLNKIKKLRNAQKPVYYLDERVIDLSRSFKKPWLQGADMSKVDGYVFLHVVSKNGFHKGLFCNQPNAEDLIKWVSDIVLSSLLTSSVIVMDKSPLHGKTVHEPITRYHSKEDMVKWLQDSNIPCTLNMRKAQLYDLIARCPVKPVQYNLDLIFRSNGHEVIRLPDNYHDLSLTEFMWDHISKQQFPNREDLLNLKTHVFASITSISAEKWSQFENTIVSTEKRLIDIDEAIEEVLDTYKIDIKTVNSNLRM